MYYYYYYYYYRWIFRSHQSIDSLYVTSDDVKLIIHLRWLKLPVITAGAADRTDQVPAHSGRVYRQFRRRVPGDTSPKPATIVVDAWRHLVASLLADVRRTVPWWRFWWNGFVVSRCVTLVDLSDIKWVKWQTWLSKAVSGFLEITLIKPSPQYE